MEEIKTNAAEPATEEEKAEPETVLAMPEAAQTGSEAPEKAEAAPVEPEAPEKAEAAPVEPEAPAPAKPQPEPEAPKPEPQPTPAAPPVPQDAGAGKAELQEMRRQIADLQEMIRAQNKQLDKLEKLERGDKFRTILVAILVTAVLISLLIIIPKLNTAAVQLDEIHAMVQDSTTKVNELVAEIDGQIDAFAELQEQIGTVDTESVRELIEQLPKFMESISSLQKLIDPLLRLMSSFSFGRGG